MLVFSLLLIQILIFGLLVFLLRHALMRPIRQTLSHLEKLNEDYTKKLEEAKKKKLEAEKYHEETLAKTKETSEKLKQQLIQEGQEGSKQVLAEARQQGEEIIRRAQLASEMMMQEIEKKIETRALEKTRQWMLQLLPGQMYEETHSHWVDTLIEKGFEDWSRFHVSEGIQEAEVITAFPLKASEKKRLQTQLNQKLGRTIPIHEKVDPELILGLRLTIDSLVIDGSFQSKIGEILRHAQSE